MIPTDFRIEPADYQADLKDLREVRETVFILEQKVPEEEEWDDLDPRSHHVIARDDNGRPIGTGRLTPELARVVPHKNILTQSVGFHGPVDKRQPRERELRQ